MSSSPPPTPPPRPPALEERRFKRSTAPCEWVESYYPGNYHPVNLGDVFHDGQYKVIRKLGYGSFSTAWLAHDLKYVALKIVVAKAESSNELKIHHHLSRVAPDETAQYITQILDEFEHRGPNGMHKCIAFETMGPSVNSMVSAIPRLKPRKRHERDRYEPAMAKGILKQALQALAFLHSHGIAHGDFQPGNMLFAVENLNHVPEEELRQTGQEGRQRTMFPVERKDGKEDKWAPENVYVAEKLSKYTPYKEGFKIKLSDLGGSYFFNGPPAKIVTPNGLRAPEMIIGDKVNKTLDIWSFGCLVFELITGRPLFCVPYAEEPDVTDCHLLDLHALIGPLPEDLFQQWKTSSWYFTPERKLFNCGLGGPEEVPEPFMTEQKTMEEMFDGYSPEVEEEEGKQIKALIRRILQYDPEKRPSAAEVLADPWFAQVS